MFVATRTPTHTNTHTHTHTHRPPHAHKQTNTLLYSLLPSVCGAHVKTHKDTNAIKAKSICDALPQRTHAVAARRPGPTSHTHTLFHMGASVVVLT